MKRKNTKDTVHDINLNSDAPVPEITLVGHNQKVKFINSSEVQVVLSFENTTIFRWPPRKPKVLNPGKTKTYMINQKKHATAFYYSDTNSQEKIAPRSGRIDPLV